MGAKRCRGKRVSGPGATTRRGVAVVMMMVTVKVVMPVAMMVLVVMIMMMNVGRATTRRGVKRSKEERGKGSQGPCLIS